MNGNASYRHLNTAILSVVGIEAPVVVTSDDFDRQLAPAIKRLRLRPGMLQKVAGIHERRWWTEDVSFIDAAGMAGSKALSEAGIDPSEVGLLINTSVSRAYLEPSTAVAVHDGMGLPTSAMNFDLANACLGFVNAIHVAGLMIDAGQIKYAVIVDGEDSKATQLATIARLNSPEATREDFHNEFASLTLGCGAAAAVLGPADENPGGHRVLGGISRAGTEHHQLCVGDLDGMRTDTKGLFEGGLALALDAWEDAKADWDWHTGMDRYVTHQISMVHTRALIKQFGIDGAQVPLTFPTLGNIGPASLPLTLAQQTDSLSAGDRVLCMGIGSGINTAMTEIIW